MDENEEFDSTEFDIDLSHLDDDDFDMDDNDFDMDLDIDDEEDKPSRSAKTAKNNKPKLIGKHSLKYDTIYKGKKNVVLTENDECQHIIKNAGGSLDINDNLIDHEESRSNIEYYRDTRLKKEIKKLLTKYTDIDFQAPRRKPSKSDFNAYFKMLLTELHRFGYNKTEIFIELSGYFSDNIWNIFLLLENKYSNIIISELKDKYGMEDINKIDFL